MDELTPTYDQRLRTMQIVAAALPAGVVLFGVIAVGLRFSSPQVPLEGQGISLFLAAFSAVLFVVHFVIPWLLMPQLLRVQPQQDAAAQVWVFQSLSIMQLGVLEGGALMNVIAYILQWNWWSLGIAGGLVLWMLTRFPTQTRLRHWLETQQLEPRSH